MDIIILYQKTGLYTKCKQCLCRKEALNPLALVAHVQCFAATNIACFTSDDYGPSYYIYTLVAADWLTNVCSKIVDQIRKNISSAYIGEVMVSFTTL